MKISWSASWKVKGGEHHWWTGVQKRNSNTRIDTIASWKFPLPRLFVEVMRARRKRIVKGLSLPWTPCFWTGVIMHHASDNTVGASV